MDPDLSAVVSFRERFAPLLSRAHEAARSEVGLDLAADLFALRVFEACELVFGSHFPEERRVARFIQGLHHTDLYVATASVEGDSRAATAIERWYGPMLPGETTDPSSPRAQFVTRRGPSAPLAHYLGVVSLGRWLAANIALMRRVRESSSRQPDLAVRAPAARRAVDIVPTRQLARRSVEERVALALALVHEVGSPELASLLGGGPRAAGALIDEVAFETIRAFEQELRADGIDDGTRAAAIRALDARGPREVVASRRARGIALLQHALRLEALHPNDERCPTVDYLLGGFAGVDGIERAPLGVHLERCGRCQRALAAALRLDAIPESPRRFRHLPALVAAVVAAAGIAWALSDRNLIPTPQSGGSTAPGEVTPAGRGSDQTTASTNITAPEVPPPSASARATPTIELQVEPAATSPPMKIETPPRSVTAKAAVATQTPFPRPRTSGPVATPSPPASSVAVSRGSKPRPQPSKPNPSPEPIVTVSEPNLAPALLLAASPAADEATALETTAAGVAATAVSSTPPGAPASPSVSGSETATDRRPTLRPALGSTPAARLVTLAVERHLPGDEQSTLALVVRALRMDPRLPEAHFNCGVLLDELGRPDDARVHWERYLGLWPRGPEAAYVRARLRQ